MDVLLALPDLSLALLDPSLLKGYKLSSPIDSGVTGRNASGKAFGLTAYATRKKKYPACFLTAISWV